MASVIGTAVARAPRNVKITKNDQLANFMKTKSVSGKDQHITNSSDVMSDLERLVDSIHSSLPTKALQSTVLNLCKNLKVFGPQLEISHKERLVKAFTHLGNICLNNKLDQISRLHIFELIEMRTNGWIAQEETSNYYQSRIAILQEPGRGEEAITGNTTIPKNENCSNKQLVKLNAANKENTKPSKVEYSCHIQIGNETITISSHNFRLLQDTRSILEAYFL